MAEKPTSPLPKLSAEQRRVVAGQYERANQVVSKGNFDYGIQLLLSCCKMDPANPTYRNTLRKTVRAKLKDQDKASWTASVSTLSAKLKVKAALHKKDYLKVLEVGEEILVKNPWDVGTHLALAEGFAGLELIDLAIWTLEQARQVKSTDATVNRALARLYERRGKFSQAMTLWEMVRKACPSDLEAQHKAKDLAASATIAKGNYEGVIAGTAKSPAGFTSPQAADAADEEEPQKETSAQEDRLAREIAQMQGRLQADPANATAYLHLAAIYRRAEQFDEARLILEKGLGPTGNHFQLAIELADLQIQPLRRDLALTEEKLRSQPKDKDLLRIHGQLQKEINLRELDYHRTKADRFPNELSHKFEVGVRLYRAGQYDEAIRELQAARNSPALHGQALYYLGYCFKQRNNWRLAQRNFEEALTHLTPKDEAVRKEVLFQLATGYADSGDLARAIDLAYELANMDFAYRDIGKLADDWQAKLQKA